MTVIQKTIGRLPVNLGDYDSTSAYGKKNRVTLYDCEWESKVDNNTHAPATIIGGVVTPDANWKLISGVPANYGLDTKMANLQTALSAESERAQAAESTKADKSDTYTKAEVNALITTPDQGFVSVTATSSTTSVTDVLPATGEPDTIYRVGNWDGTQFDDTVYSEYAWNGTVYIHLSTKREVGEVFDISAYHATGGTLQTYSDLADALGTNGANVPEGARKGGMSIKFVQSSDNKYVQYRLMTDEWSADAEDWAIADESVYVDNPEFIHVKTDAEGKILWAIKTDGSIYYGAGVPQQVVDYINERIADLPLDEYEDIVAFLNGLEKEDKTLQTLLNEKVDKEEGKSLISNDIAESVHYEDNPEFIEVKADVFKRLIEAIRINGNKVFTGNVEAKGFEGDKMQLKGVTLEVIDDQEYFIVAKDGLDRLMLGLKQDGDVVFGAGVPKQIKDYVAENGGQGKTTKTLDRRQLGNIYNAARYNTGASTSQIPNGKDFQICLSGDPHTNDIAIKHMIELTNKVLSIDAFLVLGDMNGWTPYDGYANTYDIAGVENTINNIIAEECNKPFYLVCGNHDAGEGRCVKYTRTHQQVYNTFVKPIIDKGYLKNGEYNADAVDYADKCYYFHDFNSTKTRLIVLYEYGHPLALADNEYWEPVAYDSSLADIQSGTTYTYDANNPIVLNSGNPTYKEHSFRLKKTVTTCTRSTGENYKTMPYYKMRSRQVFTKNQLEWLIATLNSTPDDYGIVIASHQCLMAGTNLTDNKFSIGSNPDNTYAPRKNGKSYDMMMDNDIIPKIVDAWKNKTSISEKVAATDFASDNQYASYLNVLQDGDYHYMYQINADFSSRTNNNAFFSNFINGHEHCDMIERSKSFPTLLTVGVTTPNPPFRYMSDVATIMDESSPIYDSITVLACSKNRVALCKYGNDTTFAGVDREYEIINPNNN